MAKTNDELIAMWNDAHKQGKVKGYDDLRAAGFTDEDITALASVPRSKEAVGGRSSECAWIGDYNTYPVSCIWNEREHALYREYRAGGGTTPRRPRVQTAPAPTMDAETYAQVHAYLKENGQDALAAKIEACMPHDKNQELLHTLLGVWHVADLKEPVNMCYCMFRKNGAFPTTAQPTMTELVEQEYMPEYGKTWVREQVETLKRAGIDITACIVDL